MKINILSITTLIFLSISGFSQGSTESLGSPFKFEATYMGENLNNLSGGIKTGSCYLGMANLKVSINTHQSGLWNGGILHISAVNTHGSSPSQELLGDMQVASNIEAGNHTFFQELWYSQAFNQFEFKIGLQDMNADFANTEHGGLFINSSFGIHSTISFNIPAPIYPLTTVGVSAKWNISEKVSFYSAIFDGCPTDFEDNPYNLKWQLNSGDGALIISEIQYAYTINDKQGIVKGGSYSHNHILENSSVDSLSPNNYGFYAVADQIFWKGDNNKEIGAFLQLGASPGKYNTNYLYLGCGVNYYGIFTTNQTDALGFAIAHSRLNNNLGNETSLEFTYKKEFSNNLFIQPDVQYIINPLGFGTKLDNSFGATLRFGFSF